MNAGRLARAAAACALLGLTGFDGAGPGATTDVSFITRATGAVFGVASAATPTYGTHLAEAKRFMHERHPAMEDKLVQGDRQFVPNGDSGC